MNRQGKGRVWRGFWQLADPKIWIASTVPMLVAAALAYSSTGRFHPGWFLLSAAGIYLIETGKNAINEHVDYKSGADRNVTPENRTPFSGGKKTIVDGKLTLGEVKVISYGTMLAACAIGLFIVLYREFNVLWIGLAGVFMSVFYSIPPFRFAYSGLGELAVGFTFGPLITTGMYLVLTGSVEPRVVAASLPIGFLIANVLWINQYPDYEADKKAGKYNWVVRMGKEKGIRVFVLMFALAYAAFLLLALLYRNPVWLLGLISVPVAVRSVRTAKREFGCTAKLIPANIGTVQVYQITGLVMVIAALSNRFVSS
jgi:1,4-dihydroxy-2-naphthoate octaprenyltransferase